MEVKYNHNDYEMMSKEVCYLSRQLNLCLDSICNKYLIDNKNEQATATFEAKDILDKLSNIIVQMNFLVCNTKEEEPNDENRQHDDCATVVDCYDSGDSLELPDAKEGNIKLLEDCESGDVEEGDKQDTE